MALEPVLQCQLLRGFFKKPLPTTGVCIPAQRPADAGVDVLSNCQLNADLNRAPPKLDGGSRAPASVLVRQLDWLDPPDWLLPPPPAGQQAPPHSDGGDPFAWRPEDLAALQRLDVLLAADCVYDDVLTESFMRW